MENVNSFLEKVKHALLYLKPAAQSFPLASLRNLFGWEVFHSIDAWVKLFPFTNKILKDTFGQTSGTEEVPA